MSPSNEHAFAARGSEPLWDRVDRNRVELALFIALFVLVSVAVLDVIATLTLGLFGLIIFSPSDLAGFGDLRPAFFGATLSFLLLSLAWVAYALSRPERWVVKRFGCVFAPKGEYLPTKMALKDMAIAAGLPIAPALYVMPQSSVNAFSFATGKRRAIVGVTHGFTEKLTVDQQRAVFANLVARLIAGDVYTAAGVASIVWPVYAWDSVVMDARNAEIDAAWNGKRGKTHGGDEVAAAFVFGVAFALLGALFEAWHRTKQLRVAEKADAEGMLLLKDPATMLSALRRCIEMDNAVPVAGEAFADLFYCWTGPARNDERDPEWARVERLKEILGVEGAGLA